MATPVVLTYHSLDDSGSVTSISPILFKQQMAFLYNNDYHCISLREWAEAVTSGRKYPPKTFILTFDDGYRDNYEIALPILKMYKYTATIFVVSGFIGQMSTWEKKEGIPDLPMLAIEDIRELSRYSIDIQPHSHSHLSLTGLEDAKIKGEILYSKKEIEALTGNQADLFCYPYGYYNGRTIVVLKNLGFKGAVTTNFGRDKIGADPFQLKRIGSPHFRTFFRFRLVMSGWYDKMIRLKRCLEPQNV